MPTKSRISNEKRCIYCGKTYGLERHHIFNGPWRSKSETDGLWVWLCEDHHRQVTEGFAERVKLKAMGQRIYEQQIGTRQEFRQRYGRYYIYIEEE